MAGKPRILVETTHYTEKFRSIGNPAEIDESLEALTWAISNKPDEFDVVPGFKTIRLAKTIPAVWASRYIPALRVWFQIVDNETVELLWIDLSQPDEIF